ncbi:sensor domain-containing protein [Ferribacterium limneticum]|uniref:sensor domain-containing protein n=1 Tax=Ferribacterium limneticum TaxID=76259 RepID=UPI001CF9C290|nr:bifunctional diguanylate cyclase/phosphodiesterase [Ferribacterium limneticum]UCV28370.1 EAL domain-containing protein [Ferribacterium limneticum]UCV32287.1 EAL domain-containing protein [Ferribacterium limneticum]
MNPGPSSAHPCCLDDASYDSSVRPPLLCDLQLSIFENAGRAIILTDPAGLIVYFNRAAQQMLGYSPDEVVGRETPLLFHLADEVATCARNISSEQACEAPDGFGVFVARLKLKNRDEADWTYVRKDGSHLPVSLAVSVLRDAKDAVQGYLGIASDISERRRMEHDLRIAAIAFESQAAIMVTDVNQRILRVNQAFTRLTGYSAEEAIGQTPGMLKSGRQDADFYAEMWRSLSHSGHWQGEIWNRRKNGEIYPEWLTISGVRDARGKVTHYVSTFSDISNLKVAESEIHHLAFYDPLTAMPNRRLLLNRLDQACAAGKRSGQFGALLIIDVDHFKTLNDTLGHDVGDLLLVEVAKRLIACIREGDTAARQGGDEFVVMLEELGTDPAGAAVQAEIVAEKIRLELARPYLLAGDTEYFRSASIGISLFFGQEKTIDILLKQADIALYKAKDAGRNAIRFFDSAMQTALDERAALEAGLRRALVRNELALYVQPQVNAERQLIGAEALLRWLPPGKALVPPNDFIPLAEETGLIVPIGIWVLDQACAELRHWADDPRTSRLFLSVNVSARQFRQADFVAQVADALARHGANPQLLKLELTESLLLDNVEEVIDKMQALRAIGVRFSLDDFGTGYASLSYLKRFPFEQLKVDRSFIRDININPDDAAIVRAIIAMGNTLRLSVVAEGVEDDLQHAYLVKHECSLFQGYLFGRPMSFRDFRVSLGEAPLPRIEAVDNWVI